MNNMAMEEEYIVYSRMCPEIKALKLPPGRENFTLATY